MKKLLVPIILAFFSLNALSQNETEAFPTDLKIDNVDLKLKGTGTREKLWMDMYTLGLFISDTQQDANKIVSGDDTSIVRLSIISGLITAEKMDKAIRDGFEKSTQGKTEPIQTEIKDFLNVFKLGVDKEDLFQFTYQVELGTTISKNGKELAKIKGLAFKQALWGIWLGKNPVDKKLKAELLK
ncbi:chalcone isomerase family protein [Ancylomarina sp. 16SWW S1-10-2]|uniref:chalcone isomerase family protein n=1 Tax=Ancylomarina sp. 16SWW S1-10-2 TaxID=2499681 RepID=UPI0012AE0ED9|nr:chalcone isomerase family protein [Ancylomarina sp. 16SWW S1-10-2]MRT93081.1 chalcone isomerase [Ancylomarina sp. 16SWW S1-10-2]